MRNHQDNERDSLNSQLSVVVCIITYRRLHGLQRLLESLCHLTYIEVEAPAWQVVVVDNDGQAPAQSLVEEIRETFPVPIIYGVEPVQGIASARNKAIELAPTCDFIAFIDDDEVADPHWLDQLLHVQRVYQADIVTGPVLADFEESPPKWILCGRLFDRSRLPTGTQRHYAATHNTLVKYAWTQALDGPFDLRYNLTGGSDSHFSRRVIQKGGQVVWADKAIVREYNPPKRMTASWLLQRSFRLAYTTALHEKELYSFFVVMQRFIKAIYHLLLGVLLIIPLFIYYGYAGVIKGLQRSARGLGALYGLFGGHYEEYAKQGLNPADPESSS